MATRIVGYKGFLTCETSMAIKWGRWYKLPNGGIQGKKRWFGAGAHNSNLIFLIIVVLNFHDAPKRYSFLASEADIDFQGVVYFC